MRTYAIVLDVLNISGNAILIWALHRTEQTKSLSFQLIIIMSTSDITTGITDLASMFLLSLKQNETYCWLQLALKCVLFTCNAFSICMVFLIALDRYLHVKYLERYSLTVAKNRVYSLVLCSALYSISMSIVFIRHGTSLLVWILELIYLSITVLAVISIIILYRRALHVLKRKAHQMTRSIIDRHRSLGKAANRISICILLLLAPITTFLIMDVFNQRYSFIDAEVLSIARSFAYITFLANGLCSSIIFISQNMPIKRLLRQTLRSSWNRMHSFIEPMESTTCIE